MYNTTALDRKERFPFPCFIIPHRIASSIPSGFSSSPSAYSFTADSLTLVTSLVAGLVAPLVTGLVAPLVAGLVTSLVAGLVTSLVAGLVVIIIGAGR